MSMYVAPHQSGERKFQTTVPKPRDEGPKFRSPRACIILASTGLEPREVQEPWQYMTNHGFFIEFATWDGKPATADTTLLSHAVWGSKYSVQEKWKDLTSLDEWKAPHAWAPLTRSSTLATAAPTAPAQDSSPQETTSSPVSTDAQSKNYSRPTETLRLQVSQTSGREFDLESYDLVFIPGGWATREHLEKDTKLHALLSKYCLNLTKSLGCKVLAVVGDGISPLLNVEHPLTKEPLLQRLVSTGPGYDSWSGIITGKDLGSQIPGKVKTYVTRKVTVDPDNWYISSPASSYNDDFCPSLVALVQGAVKVSEFRKLERENKRLSTVQSNQLQSALEYDGLTRRQKERLNVDGIGKRETGFVLSKWSWGWRREIE